MQTPIRRVLTTLAVAAAVAVVAPGVAHAHTATAADNCAGLTVTLINYEGGPGNNRVTVTIDGAGQTFDFGSSFNRSFTWAQTAAHSWTVVVDANRNNGHPTLWDRAFNGSEQPCQTPTTSTTTTSTTTTSTAPPNTPTSTTVTPTTTTTATDPSTTTLPPESSTSTTPPTNDETTVPPPTEPTPPSSVSVASTSPPALPATGAETSLLLGVAAGLLLVGALTVWATRRPR